MRSYLWTVVRATHCSTFQFRHRAVDFLFFLIKSQKCFSFYVVEVRYRRAVIVVWWNTRKQILAFGIFVPTHRAGSPVKCYDNYLCMCCKMEWAQCAVCTVHCARPNTAQRTLRRLRMTGQWACYSNFSITIFLRLVLAAGCCRGVDDRDSDLPFFSPFFRFAPR